MIRWLFISVFAPAYSRLLHLIAYGPWGSLHRVLIFIFKKIYGITWSNAERFATLGDFFLRSVRYQIGSSPLVSPAEANVLEGPAVIQLEKPISVKGLTYTWKNFREIDVEKFKSGTFWNLYLAPYHYHWVHAAAAGKNLRAYRHHGRLWPVNGLGRFLCPTLYSENERLTFTWESEDFGQIAMICIGAMGVSDLHSQLGEVPYGAWKTLAPKVEKGQKLLGFKLGSTVVLLTEQTRASFLTKTMVRVGDDFAPVEH